jgi:hypothetical protein
MALRAKLGKLEQSLKSREKGDAKNLLSIYKSTLHYPAVRLSSLAVTYNKKGLQILFNI